MFIVLSSYNGLYHHIKLRATGGLWLSSRGLGCAPVYSGGGDAGWFGGLFWLFVFELVRFALLSLDFGIGLLVGRVFGHVKVSALVVCELRSAFLTCVGSLVGRSLLIRGREQVCDSCPFRLLWCLLR